MRHKSLALASVVLLAVSTVQSIHAQEPMAQHASAAVKFVPIAGLPPCLIGAVKRGDPSKEAFVVLAKVTAGCKIPWHWHTATEELMIVTGRAKLEMREAEMKEASPATLGPGDYIHLPSKHVHRFTCLSACKFFIVSDGAFDIHYVDAAGKEIPQDEALKPARGLARKTKMESMH